MVVDPVEELAKAKRELEQAAAEDREALLGDSCSELVRDGRIDDAFELVAYAWRDHSVVLDEDHKVTLTQVALRKGLTHWYPVVVQWLCSGVGLVDRLEASAQELVVQLALTAPAAGRWKALDACLAGMQFWGTDGVRKPLVRWLVMQPRRQWHARVDNALAQEQGDVWRDVALGLREKVDACPEGINKRCVEDLAAADTVFVAHPFSAHLADPYRKAIRPACTPFGLAPIFKVKKGGRSLTCAICHGVRTSRLLIADLTPDCVYHEAECPKGRANPNVAFEVGLALAYGTPVVVTRRLGSGPSGIAALTDLHPLVCEYQTYPQLTRDLPDMIKECLGGTT